MAFFETSTPYGHPLLNWAKTLSDRIAKRRGAQELKALDPHLRRDVGVTSAELRRNSLPTSQEASDQLYRVSLNQFRPWL